MRGRELTRDRESRGNGKAALDGFDRWQNFEKGSKAAATPKAISASNSGAGERESELQREKLREFRR